MIISSASFTGTNNDTVLAQTDQGEITIPLPPHAEIVVGSQAAFSEWMANGGGFVSGWVTPVIVPDPILAAQDWVNKFFDATQLLRMERWATQKALTDTVGEKLEACVAWEAQVEAQAAQGQLIFKSAPYTFSQVAMEVLTSQ